ncbi:MAG: TIGR01841 family phasin [Gammaproteobacteria bacterium]
MQRSDDVNRAANNGARRAINFAEIMVQGSARMFEIQAAAARTFCQYQAKSAAILGAPDWSELFKGNGNTRLFESTAEEVLSYMRQTSETVAEIQSDMCHLVEQQTAELSDQLRHGLEETGALMREGLEESKRMTEQAAERAAPEAKRAKRA